MKVLHVKNGSNRNKKFQLQTMIYEENGRRFVKKSVLFDEALPHLHQMKINYTNLSNLIINKKIKLANIVFEDERSITFEYIEGKSLENPTNKTEVDSFIQKNRLFFQNGFQTTKFDSKNLSTDFIKMFGDFDYSILDGELCFQGFTNIDLVSSNIIVKGDEFYIIDYEWVFDFELPIDYILFRNIYSDIRTFDFVTLFNNIYMKIEENFISNYVCDHSFSKYQKQYFHKKYTINQEIKQKDQQLHEKDLQLHEKDLQLHEKDLQLHEIETIAQSLRLKNRIKKLLGLKKG